MAVPYTFGSATTSIPLSQLDSNFATAITLGNTAVQLGNTITNLTGVSNVASASSLSLGTSGNTTAVTIDTSQNVGIGITPVYKLDVYGGASGTRTDIVARNASANLNIAVLSDNNGAVSSTNSTLFYTNASERMRIDSSGNLLVGATSAVNSSKFLVAGINGTSPVFQGAASAGSYLRFYNNAQTTGDLQIGQGKASGSDNVGLIYNNSNAALVFGTNGTEVSRFTSSGVLLVGKTTADQSESGAGISGPQTAGGSAVVAITNTSSSGADNSPPLGVFKAMTTTSSSARFVQFYANNGSTAMGGIVGNGASNVQFAALSDAREKTNIQPISGSLNKVLALKPSSFDWIATNEHNPAGFIAQDVQTVFPEFVVENIANEGEEQRYGLTGGMTGGIIPHLVKAIQELKAINDTQAETINALTARITALEAK
jgi:hypothetical protein